MNFIHQYYNVLSEDLLKILESIIDNNIQYNVRSTPSQNDKQLPLEPFWPDIAEDVNHSLRDVCLSEYLNKFPYLLRHFNWTSGISLLQKTSPYEGYHDWHCENMAWNNKSRSIAWMIYLNDVEEGGETEFLYQQKKFKPIKNTALLWPGSWDHLHRGNPPVSGNKYILTGWYHPITSLPSFRVEK